jgi:hypothetical protein
MRTIALISLISTSQLIPAAVTFGPVIYRQTSDSPFYAGIMSGDIQLEDFEDSQLNITGVFVPRGSIQTGLGVDSDDGVLDLIGVNNRWQLSGGASAIYFDVEAERGYPLYVGLVLIGFSPLPENVDVYRYIEAFDMNGRSLASPRILQPHGPPDQTDTWAGGNQFVGFYAPEGIAYLVFGAIAFDHLQVGWSIPESGTLSLSALALSLLVFRRSRSL